MCNSLIMKLLSKGTLTFSTIVVQSKQERIVEHLHTNTFKGNGYP